jgi:REP element-mobilizing transposase RayT
MQKWLDAGHGSCVLKNSTLREIMASSFHHYDGQRYHLHDFVIMPNHVHVLFTPFVDYTMQKTVAAWKSFSGHTILKQTNGDAPFWLEE